MLKKIDPRDVLTYLNELGYTNINAQQLKDFITDLRKLMKYENRRHKENLELGTVNSNTNFHDCHFIQSHINQIQCSPKDKSNHYCDHPLCPRNEANTSRSKEELDAIFDHLYSQHTVASRAKEVPRKEKHISVHIRKPKNKLDVHEHCTHHETRPEENNDQPTNLQIIQNIETTSDGSKLYINTESTIKSTDPGSKQSITTKPSTAKKKSKCSFIKCTSAKPINRSDPVALYHYYQEQWKKQKFPGQENHLDLRWSVREKLLGGPKLDTYSTTSTSRKRSNSWKG